MAAQRTTFEKLQRDRAKKAKAAQKRERRRERMPDEAEPGTTPTPVADTGGELSAEQLLATIERIHRDLDAGRITFDDFEEQKAELLARLPID